MADPVQEFMEYIQETKLKTLPFITNPDNVIIGETGQIDDFLNYDVDDYPRIETLFDKQKGDGYVDQTSSDESSRFSYAGYFYYPEEADALPNDQRMYNLVNYANRTLEALRSVNRDKIDGTAPRCFIQVGAFYTIDYEYEFIDGVDSFLIALDYKLNLSIYNREV